MLPIESTPIDAPPEPADRDLPIHDLVDRTAAGRERAPAVAWGSRTATYGELVRRSNGLAHALLERGVGAGRPVAVLSRSPLEVVASILGILKAGAVFVPLDPTFPHGRLEAMWRQADPACVVAGAEAMAAAAELAGGGGVLAAAEAGERDDPPGVELGPDAPCSIFFTSGSTGRPKAILGRLKGIGHFVRWEAGLVDVGDGSRVSQLASPSFDGFLKDVFVPLVAGGTACAPESRDVLLDAARLADWIDVEEIEVLHCVPSVLRALLHEPLTGDYFPELRWVVVAGEVLHPADVARFTAVFGERVRLLNLYGPTETTVTKLFHVVEPADAGRSSVPIGRPMPGAAAMILGPTGQPLRPGMVGEIYLRTPYRSLGYHGDREATEAAFVRNPFRDDGDDLVYRTGDFGRLLEDGRFEFLGRRDQQVKVRGVRVELGELESHLRRHPAVLDAAVVDRRDGDGETTLCAYLVLAGGTEVAEVRGFLAAQVPEAMVPSTFLRLDELPRTLNGKVDRRALPTLDEVRAGGAETGQRPRTPLEEIVAGIWAQVLKLDRVGVDESFFDLGGHSLLATQILSRMRAALRVDLPLRTFLEAPTVAGLAAAAERAQRSGAPADAAPIEPVPRGGDLPLSFAQQRMWFLERLDPGSGAYHVPLLMRVRGRLDVAALRASFEAVARRHEVLRTTYPAPDGLPVQRVREDGGLDFRLVDLEPLPAAGREAAALDLAAADGERSFDLEAGPLLRVVVARLGGDDHLVACTFHHVVADGWSRGVLVDDLTVLYRAFAAGAEPRLPELPIQYADYAAWQRRTLRGERLEAELEAWRRRLAGAPPLLPLPTDRPRPAVPTRAGGRVPLRLSGELAGALRGLGRQSSITLYMVLAAAFTALLHRYSGEEDLVFGSSVAGREHVDLERLIGFFVNMLALRVDCAGDPSFAVLLGRVRDVAVDALAHQSLPFELLVEDLQPERDLGVPPVFQVVFSLQNAPVEELELPGLELSFPPTRQTAAKYDLLLDTWEDGDGLGGTLEYAADLFDPATAERLARHFANLLASLAAAPGARLSELSMLSGEEQRQLLAEHGGEAAAAGAACREGRSILDLISAPPGGAVAVAVTCRGESLTYRRLRRRAARVARHLARAGIGRGSRVGLCCEHSLEEVVGLLGILESGAAYVPLDPRDPARRWAFTVADAGVSVVLTQRRLAPRLDGCGADVACLDTRWPEVEAAAGEPALPAVSADDLAYVLYTSGSTGEPKGVAVSHRSLVRYVEWAAATYVRGDRVALPLYSPLTFDLTVTTLYLALVTGNPLHVYPQDGAEPNLERLLDEDAVDVVKLTPSHLALMRHRDLAASRARRLIVGGEALPWALSREVAARFGGGVEIYNEYGPTEATVGCMIHRFDPAAPERPTVPIGRAAEPARAYLLDRRLQPVPAGVCGELFIGGDAVAVGYWGRPALTAGRFLPDPFAAGDRMYRTGDLARRLPSGDLEYLGRGDEQVKLHGHRIEPGEVEAVLAAHPDVERCVALVAGEGDGRRLVVYLVTAPGAAPRVEDLRRFAAERLPRHLVPAQLVSVPAIPVTAHGKVDRGALVATRLERPLLETPYVEPEGEVERAVAAIWQRVLGAERVGALDDFFHLGGQSILAAQVVHRINQAFAVEVPLRAVFSERTVAGLALLVEQSLIDRLESEQKADRR
jgi:amino acid adenylation domain-containing protein